MNSVLEDLAKFEALIPSQIPFNFRKLIFAHEMAIQAIQTLGNQHPIGSVVVHLGKMEISASIYRYRHDEH